MLIDTQHMDSLIAERHMQIETPVLEEVTKGLNEGKEWILSRYHLTEAIPIFEAEKNESNQTRQGYGSTPNGDKIIIFQTGELKKLEAISNLESESVTITEEYGREIPESVWPVLTIKQWYEGFIIEELLHWLQDMGTKDLVRLPPREKILIPNIASELSRLLQPHEFEALQIRGIYYKEKYGYNPCQELENYLITQI